MQTNNWHRLDKLDAAIRQRVQLEINDLLETHPQATLDHDPAWLSMRSQAEDQSVRLYVYLGPGSQLLGYAPFFVHSSSLGFDFANYRLGRMDIRRWSITGEPLLIEHAESASDAISALLARVRQDLRGREVLFTLGLHLDSPLGNLAQRGAVTGYLTLPYGPRYLRRLAAVESTLDAYLAKLGPKTRADLRRQERRLLKQADEQVECRVVTSSDAIAAFLGDVENVSRRTYQWHLLGIGIQNNARLIEFLSSAASRGWFRGYVLCCKGKPVAFMIGYLYRGVYLSESIGFDPAWAEWSVGNVLHLHVMRDLGQLGDRVRWFDFLYGDNSNKERLSNRSHPEQNIYLAPNTLRWRSVLWALRVFHRATDVISGILDRYQLKQKLRRLMKMRSTRGSGSSASTAEASERGS